MVGKDKIEIPERTEEDILTQAGIKVVLGGRDYFIKPLVIRDSGPWRKKAAPFLADLARIASVKSDKPEDFKQALMELMGSRIDETLNLFFEYAKDLDREEIEQMATDGEVIKAFNGVVKIAFPFGE